MLRTALLFFSIIATTLKSFHNPCAALLPEAGTASCFISRRVSYRIRSNCGKFFVMDPNFSGGKTTTDGIAKINPLEALGLPQPLILGSSSFTRKLILKEMGINFKVHVHPIDEKVLGDRTSMTPESLVRLIATAKADALVEGILKGEVNINAYPSSDNGCGGHLILTGDQVVVAQNKILEKPESIDEARSFVQMYSQNPPSTVGACVITHIPSKVQVVGVERATIHFKPTIASSNLLDRLLEDGAPILSCAGGLMIEHPFVKEHVDNIEGTEDAVMGLSKDLVMTLLHNIKNTIVETSCQTNGLD